MATELTSKLKPWVVPARTYPVEAYGAKAGGSTTNTSALQKAIDACSADGGGVVLLSKGDYVTGTIDLKSGVMLEISKESRLLASTNLADFTVFFNADRKENTVVDVYVLKSRQSD